MVRISRAVRTAAAMLGYAVEAARQFSGRNRRLPHEGGPAMFRMLLHWILNAAALWLVSRYVSGFVVDGWKSALIAVVVIGLFNATFGLLLKIITLPLGILTFGLFFLVINAVVLKFASDFVPGFDVVTWKAALLGALALAVLHMLIGFLFPKRRPRQDWARN
jgi:putative membrane protein